MSHESLIQHPTPETSIEINGVTISHGDMYKVVDSFYSKVQKDPLLSVPFASVEHWPEHIERLTHFWWVRLGGHPYMQTSYDPVTKHYKAGFNQEFLERWLDLFRETTSEHLEPQAAKLWSFIGERMGQGLTMKNEFYRSMVEAASPKGD